MASIRQLFCQHNYNLISEKVLEYNGENVEIQGGFSIHKHLLGLHSKTLVQTFKCSGCNHIRTMVTRHNPLG